MSAQARLNLAISLPLRNTNDLARLIQDLYNPASPRFHHYLTPTQFTEQFGPTPADYEAVKSFAKANGFEILGTHPNRTLVDVRASVENIENAFHLHLNRYPHPVENRTFFSPDTEPSLNLTTEVLYISGLSDFVKPHPTIAPFKPDNSAPLGSPLGVGSATNGGFIGEDFRAAYAPNVTLTGAGESVGLFELGGGYYPSDIAAYESEAGLPNVPLTPVLLDGYDGSPGVWEVNTEVSLDIEMAISMAPGLDQVLVYEGYLPDSILSQMATDDIAKQLSASWVYGIDAESQQLYQQFATQGQSFFNSSGDGGAWGNSIPTPCDNPYITIVGGTVLTTSNAGGGWAGETTWSGSGGAISSTYAIPSWQQGISMTASGGSTNMRNLPDVALTADNVYIVAINGATGTSGGTSASTPLWAGYAALINEQALAGGQQTMGFLNPALYTVGKGSSPRNNPYFHDIVTGNTTNSTSPDKFYAVPGYDLCTGWGTPAGLALINELANPDALLILPTEGFKAAGGVGGPYTVNEETLTLTNTGSNTISWTSTNPASWLTIAPTSGTIAPGQSANVTANLNSAAYSLPVGSYSNVVIFTNQNDSTVYPRPFVLSVLTPPSIVTEPTNQSVVAQQTAAFTISATGGKPLSYQWFFNGTALTDVGNISGSLTTNLTITNASVTNAGSYEVTVTNAAQKLASSVVNLRVIPEIAIYQQPANETVPVGSTAAFSVAAYGQQPFTYQWMFNDTNISGATGPSLVITNVQSPQTGTYTIAISNAYGGVVGAPAVLATATASNVTANFDILPAYYYAVSNGYSGLNWSNFYAGSSTLTPNSGWSAGVISQSNVAGNGGGVTATITQTNPFNLISSYVTAVFSSSQQFEIQGYNAGVLLYDTTNNLSDITPTNFQFDYIGVTEVDFISLLSGSPGGYLAMDNMVFAEGTGGSVSNPIGSLRVVIEPAAANSSGALWQVDGALPQSSGTTLTNVQAINHTVSFLPLSGWTTPTNQNVSVASKKTATVTGTYLLSDPPIFTAGSLQWDTNGFYISILNPSGLTAVVQSSTNLRSWKNIYTNSGSFQFTDTNAPHLEQQYYRVILP